MKNYYSISKFITLIAIILFSISCKDSKPKEKKAIKPKKELFKTTIYGYENNPNNTSSSSENIKRTVKLDNEIKEEFKKTDKQLETR